MMMHGYYCISVLVHYWGKCKVLTSTDEFQNSSLCKICTFWINREYLNTKWGIIPSSDNSIIFTYLSPLCHLSDTQILIRSVPLTLSVSVRNMKYSPEFTMFNHFHVNIEWYYARLIQVWHGFPPPQSPHPRRQHWVVSCDTFHKGLIQV